MRWIGAADLVAYWLEIGSGGSLVVLGGGSRWSQLLMSLYGGFMSYGDWVDVIQQRRFKLFEG